MQTHCSCSVFEFNLFSNVQRIRAAVKIDTKITSLAQPKIGNVPEAEAA